MTEKVTSADISAAALRVFSREEIQQMPRPMRLSLASMIARRLEKPGPAPTRDELQGFRNLVEQDLWHPALGRAARL